MSRPVPAVFGSEFYPEMPTVAYQNGAWQPVRCKKAPPSPCPPVRTACTTAANVSKA